MLTEAGRPYVFVQTGGESFARRYIENRHPRGDLVGVRNGSSGERVFDARRLRVPARLRRQRAAGGRHVH